MYDIGGATTSQTGLRERYRRRVQKTTIWLPQSLSTISLPLWSSSLRECPVTRDCILEAFKMTSTGPLVNMEGEKTGGVYSARKFLLFSPTEAWSPSHRLSHILCSLITSESPLPTTWCPPNHSGAMWDKGPSCCVINPFYRDTSHVPTKQFSDQQHLKHGHSILPKGNS